jgi:hypothetical protein
MALRITTAASNRGIAPSDFLPMDFFDIREEISPKAPIKLLVKWGCFSYGVLSVLFVALFIIEINKVSVSSVTSIQPDVTQNAEDNAVTVCDPLSTFVGTDDVLCDKSVIRSPVRFSMTTLDPYDEGGFLDGFVTCGTMVRSTREVCDERTAGVCSGYKRAIEDTLPGSCVDDTGVGGGYSINWGDGYTKVIRREINLDEDADHGRQEYDYFNTDSGPFPNGGAYYSVSKNSLSFGNAWSLSGTNVAQDGTCAVTQTWLDDCESFLSNTCVKVGLLSGPYACTKTTESKASIFEAIGTAYANLGFFSSLLLPAVAMLVVKIHEREEERIKMEGGASEVVTGVEPRSPMRGEGDDTL